MPSLSEVDAASSTASAAWLYEDDDTTAAEHSFSPDTSPSKYVQALHYQLQSCQETLISCAWCRWRRAGSSKHTALSVGYSDGSRPLGSVPGSPGGTGYISARSYARGSQQGLSTTSDGGYSSSDVSVGAERLAGRSQTLG